MARYRLEISNPMTGERDEWFKASMFLRMCEGEYDSLDVAQQVKDVQEQADRTLLGGFAELRIFDTKEGVVVGKAPEPEEEKRDTEILCKFCGRSFKRKCNLARHVKAKHGEEAKRTGDS